MFVFETLQAHQRTSALRAGIELKLFTAIAAGARTPEALAPVCAASAKGLRVLCDFLTIIGFLTKDEAGYGLTPDSELFLVEGSPAYVGGMASFLFHPFMEKGLGSMTGAVRKGGTILPAEGSVSDDNPVWIEFARGMAPMTLPSSEVVAQLTAGSGPMQVLDIAAGHGMYGLTIARRNPAAKIHALDWKNVLAVAHENAVKFGTADRWHAIEGSALRPDKHGPVQEDSRRDETGRENGDCGNGRQRRSHHPSRRRHVRYDHAHLNRDRRRLFATRDRVHVHQCRLPRRGPSRRAEHSTDGDDCFELTSKRAFPLSCRRILTSNKALLCKA
jgi:hypothetical protein